MKSSIGCACLCGLLLGVMPATASLAAEPQPLAMELNKLETAGDACRVYLVFRNQGTEDFDLFKLDLVLFGTDGVISRRLAVDAAPLRAGRTTVKLFDLQGQECGRVGSILVNDVIGCAVAKAEVPDCIGRLATSSKATAELTK